MEEDFFFRFQPKESVHLVYVAVEEFHFALFQRCHCRSPSEITHSFTHSTSYAAGLLSIYYFNYSA